MMIRQATIDDLPLMMRMFDHSRSVMRQGGNTTQWVGYPTAEGTRADIGRGVAYLVGDCGTFVLQPGDEPTYAHIEQGRWLRPAGSYMTLHRMAALPGAHGVAAEAIAFAKRRSPCLRADTHASNAPMRHILERHGFIPAGTVFMADATPRIAFEWFDYPEVAPGLRDFVERQVLPRYAAFDPAHRQEHARRVVARAMLTLRDPLFRDAYPGLADLGPRLPDLVFAAAAMHDLGLAGGRDDHHLRSGAVIRSCSALLRWLSPDGLELVAQAAEDHRASASRPPRSLVGRIVAEADRDVEPHTILRRTVQYSLGHYPDLSPEGHLARCMDHLREKYAAGGYLRLWLDPSPNAAPLAELRALIDDPSGLARRLAALIDDEARLQ